MALPSSAYGIASFTNPASDLTDYVGYVDLSLMPQTWWDLVTSSDGARGRVSKDDAPAGDNTATEIAADWVEFDDVAQTGKVWFRWSGTLASTGLQEPRIYPPQTGNTAYLATDTFGRNAVYINQGVLHELESDPSGTAPQFTDRTGNGNNGTSNGSMTSADLVTGKLGNAIEFDGNDDYINIQSEEIGSYDTIWVSTVIKYTNSTNAQGIVGTVDDGGTDVLQIRANLDENENISAGDIFTHRRDPSGNSQIAGISSDLNNGAWRFVDIIIFSGVDSAISFYVDGSQVAETYRVTDTISGFADYQYPISLGARNLRGTHDSLYEGAIDRTFISNYNPGADYIDLKYQNQSDPATFWGTWTVEGGGGTTALSGTSNTIIAGNANALSNKDISGASQTISQTSSGILSNKTLAGMSDTVSQTTGNVLKSATLLSISQTISQASGNAISQKELSALSETLSISQADLEALISLQGTSQTIVTGSGNIEEIVDNALSGAATTFTDANGDVKVAVSLSGASQTNAQGQARVDASIQISGRSVTIVGGRGALDLAAELSGRSVTLSKGVGELSLLGQAYTGTLTLSENKLYVIQLEVVQKEITLKENKLYTITLTETG